MRGKDENNTEFCWLTWFCVMTAKLRSILWNHCQSTVCCRSPSITNIQKQHCQILAFITKSQLLGTALVYHHAVSALYPVTVYFLELAKVGCEKSSCYQSKWLFEVKVTTTADSAHKARRERAPLLQSILHIFAGILLTFQNLLHIIRVS